MCAPDWGNSVCWDTRVRVGHLRDLSDRFGVVLLVRYATGNRTTRYPRAQSRDSSTGRLHRIHPSSASAAPPLRQVPRPTTRERARRHAIG